MSWQASRNHGRNVGGFNNPQNITGFRVKNQNVTLGWNQNLSKSAERALAIDVALSYQADRQVVSLLTRQAELDTRDPFGGFILGSIDFLFDFDNFPLNQELINNYRNNTPGSRRSPLDVDNIDQYALIDRYRNSPYGLGGGSDFSASILAAALDVKGGTIQSARVGLTGASTHATRLSKVEAALAGKPLSKATIEAAAKDAGAEIADVNSDIHASEEYRRAMIPVFTRRALEAAMARA